MNRAVFLLVAALMVAAFQIISNCAQPLESSDLSPSPSPGPQGRVDTLYVYDTVLVIHGGKIDTVIVVDTIIQYDTTVITDTIIDVDTVVIPDSIIIDTIIIPDTTIVDTVVDTIILPDTTIVDTVVDTVILPDTTIIVDTVIIIEPGDGPMLCDRLSSAQQEIIWLFRNAEGPFSPGIRCPAGARPSPAHPDGDNWRSGVLLGSCREPGAGFRRDDAGQRNDYDYYQQAAVVRPLDRHLSDLDGDVDSRAGSRLNRPLEGVKRQVCLQTCLLFYSRREGPSPLGLARRSLDRRELEVYHYAVRVHSPSILWLEYVSTEARRG